MILISTPLISLGQWSCGDNLNDARDGRIYATVQIGTQCWMAENLNYGTMIPSSQAGSIMTDNAVIEKYCWDNDSTWCNGTNGHPKYGGFYEWQEAMNYYGDILRGTWQIGNII